MKSDVEIRDDVIEELRWDPQSSRQPVRKVTPDKFLEALRPYGGTVLRTSLPHDAEQQLMKALHGDDPTAPTWEQLAGSAGAQA